MAPDFGAGLEVLIFLTLTVLQILLSFAVCSYGGYSFLTVFVNTAAGNDEVRWPGDPFQDWIFKFFHLLWLLAVWAVPASLVLGALALPRPWFFVALGGLLWLVFPLCLLSSLSGASQMVVFRPSIFALLLRHGGSLVRFYAITGIIVAVSGGLWYVSILTDYAIVLPLAAVLGAAGFLVYARLLGRLGWVVSLRQRGKKKQEQAPEEAERIVTFDPWSTPDAPPAVAPEPPPRPRPAAAKPKKKRKARRQVVDPWAIPDEALPEAVLHDEAPTDPYGPAEGSYDLMAEDKPVQPPPPQAVPDPALEGYALAEMSAPGPAPAPATPEVSAEELAMAAPRRPSKLPPRPLADRVYAFLLYPTTLGPLCTLVLGFLGIGGLLRAQIAAFPSVWKQ